MLLPVVLLHVRCRSIIISPIAKELQKAVNKKARLANFPEAGILIERTYQGTKKMTFHEHQKMLAEPTPATRQKCVC